MISFILFILKPIICASKLASQPLADSLRQAAIAIGDRYGECFALQVKFLYEYYKPNNFRHFDQSLQVYMDKVLSYGMDRFYFYAVSMKTFYYTREKRYLEGFLYLQEQTNIAESRNNHYGICMLHRMTGVIQHSRGELLQAIASYKKAIDLYKKYGYTRNISREMLAIADCYRLECNYEGVVSAAEEARSYCVTQADRNNVAIYETYGLFMLGRYAEFADRCQYLKNNKQPLDNGYNIINHAFAACSAIYEHRDDDVHVLRKRFLVKRLNDANAKLDKSINELNVAMDRAQESERLKTLFLQNMSDDLRTPLNAIVGFSRLLTHDDNGLNEDEKKEIAQGIVDNSEVLTTLVNDILDMAEQRSRAANNGDLQTV